MKSKIILLVAILANGFGLLAQSGVEANGLLRVRGNQIINNKNVPFSVAGMSLFWSSFQNDGGKFYTEEVVDHLVEDWDIQVVRAAMGVEDADSGIGYISDPVGEYAKVKRIIDAAIANNIYVIVDFHSHYAFEFETQAIKFFTDIANEYKDNDNIIYEIFNEPIAETRAKASVAFEDGEFEKTWNNAIRPYAINVINAIRKIDQDNMIIVGTPGFSQGVETAADNPIVLSDLDPNIQLPFGEEEPNIAYTFHFYAGSRFHPPLKENVLRAVQRIPIFVTEWGTVEESGDGAVNREETLDWMERILKANNISHANWSVSDKREGASIIQPGAGINGLLRGNLTDTGNFVRCIIENWQSDNFVGCELDGTTTLSTPEFDADLAALVSVYPNPVVDFVTVEVATNATVEYRIFDLNGSELVAKTQYTEALDFTNLSTGIYFVQLFINNQTQVYKFIKQ